MTFGSVRDARRRASLPFALFLKPGMRYVNSNPSSIMPESRLVAVRDLTLDLKNFRTIPQSDETSAINTMVSINPDWFWALMESLTEEDGYLPTENIIVIKNGGALEVKEGNRRIAVLKLILGIVEADEVQVPSYLQEKIAALSADWRTKNEAVPCTVYEASEAAVVDRIVTLTHGKGEKAGRDKWNAVARARHNRDKNNVREWALDLLERYLKVGKNLNTAQKERWSGIYNLTVLEEAVKRIAPRLGGKSAVELADGYPKIKAHRTILESILRDVGSEILTFDKIRSAVVDFAQVYGVPPPAAPKASTSAKPNAKAGGSKGKQTANQKTKAVSSKDPRSVYRTLRDFAPRGAKREKLVTLLEEARRLKLDKTPLAFCFVLRSMFEVSAKAYCADHHATGGPRHTKADGSDRTLADVLQDIYSHLTKNNTDKLMQRELHGAIAELRKAEGFLSVTSMNQLVHNSRFTVDETHIGTLFGNIFPLLNAMNQ